MERRFVRSNVQFPIDLMWAGKTGSFQSPGGLVDISQGG